MEWVAAVILLSLVEYLVFGMMVGGARSRYGVAAPATTGNEVFERYMRVQQNTIEQLVVFIPSIWFFGQFISSLWASVLGVVFIIGRALYAAGYISDPKKRAPGFALSMLPTMALLIGALFGAIRAMAVG